MVRVCPFHHILDMAANPASTEQKGIGGCHSVVDGCRQCASRQHVGQHLLVSESDILFRFFPYRLSVEEYG